MIDIKAKANDARAVRLSNFTDRPFVVDGVQCAGLEGFMQALKCKDAVVQKEICMLSGKAAKKRGEAFDDWKLGQQLWWQSVSYDRSGRPYYELVSRVYDAVYDQDPSLKADLLATGFEDITHSIGKTDMRDTVLTEVEMIHQLNRLRIRALRDRQ